LYDCSSSYRLILGGWCHILYQWWHYLTFFTVYLEPVCFVVSLRPECFIFYPLIYSLRKF
jgi:hypothetical protein